MVNRIAVFTSMFAITGLANAGTPPQQWVKGKNYFEITNSQSASQRDKVVVTEVFSFACTYCNELEPYIDELRAKLPKGVVLEYMPASFIPTEDWPVFQRAYFAAKVLGLDTPASHDAMYKAIWGPKGQLAINDTATQRAKVMAKMPKIGAIAKFYAKFGGRPAQFIATAKSFSVNMEMNRADKQIATWGVTGTPTIVVDGKWKTDVSSANGDQELIDLTLYLVNIDLAAKRGK